MFFKSANEVSYRIFDFMSREDLASFRKGCRQFRSLVTNYYLNKTQAIGLRTSYVFTQGDPVVILNGIKSFEQLAGRKNSDDNMVICSRLLVDKRFRSFLLGTSIKLNAVCFIEFIKLPYRIMLARWVDEVIHDFITSNHLESEKQSDDLDMKIFSRAMYIFDLFYGLFYAHVDGGIDKSNYQLIMMCATSIAVEQEKPDRKLSTELLMEYCGDSYTPDELVAMLNLVKNAVDIFCHVNSKIDAIFNSSFTTPFAIAKRLCLTLKLDVTHANAVDTYMEVYSTLFNSIFINPYQLALACIFHVTGLTNIVFNEHNVNQTLIFADDEIKALSSIIETLQCFLSIENELNLENFNSWPEKLRTEVNMHHHNLQADMFAGLNNFTTASEEPSPTLQN